MPDSSTILYKMGQSVSSAVDTEFGSAFRDNTFTASRTHSKIMSA